LTLGGVRSTCKNSSYSHIYWNQTLQGEWKKDFRTKSRVKCNKNLTWAPFVHYPGYPYLS